MIHEAASTGFGEQAAVYANARPGYHPRLIQRFVERFGGATVVDLGAGSGIFTSQLVAAGCTPIAIEPVDAMRSKLIEANPSVVVHDGTAEQTGLGDSSVNTVVAAQAFHWFSHTEALNEIRRILCPGGHLVCVWNVRDETVPWVAELTKILDRHAGDTPRHRTMKWRRAIEADDRLELVDDWAIANPMSMTPDTLADRALSTSFIAALDSVPQRGVLDDVRALGASLGSAFDLPYRSEMQAWTAR